MILNEVALPEVEYGEGDSIISDLLPSKPFPSHVFWILGLWLSSYQGASNETKTDFGSDSDSGFHH